MWALVDALFVHGFSSSLCSLTFLLKSFFRKTIWVRENGGQRCAFVGGSSAEQKRFSSVVLVLLNCPSRGTAALVCSFLLVIILGLELFPKKKTSI